MPETRIRNVIVVGASGNLGPSIVRALDTDPEFSVSILGRHNSTYDLASHIPIHRVDDSYPEKELLKAFNGQDAVVSAMSLTNVLSQLPLIEAAVKAGVRHFIPAEYGGNKEASGAKGEVIPRHNEKEDVIQLLRKKEEDGLRWTAIATGPFFDWGLRNGFLGYDLKSHKARIYDSGEASWTATNVGTIGMAVAGVLRHPEEAANRFVYIYSVRASQNELFNVLENLSGAKWEKEAVSMDEAIKSGHEALAKGNRMGVIPLIHSYFFREGMGADYTADVKADNDLLGLPSESLEMVVQNILEGST